MYDWKIRLSHFLLSHRYIFQIIRDFVTVLGCKLTNFKPRLLSRAVVVHLAHKGAHLHRVLVLMVQAVGLEEAEESHERTESDWNLFLRNKTGLTGKVTQ